MKCIIHGIEANEMGDCYMCNYEEDIEAGNIKPEPETYCGDVIEKCDALVCEACGGDKMITTGMMTGIYPRCFNETFVTREHLDKKIEAMIQDKADSYQI